MVRCVHVFTAKSLSKREVWLLSCASGPGKGYRSLPVCSWCITAGQKHSPSLSSTNSQPSPSPTASPLSKTFAKLKSSGEQGRRILFFYLERTKNEIVVVKKEILSATTGMQSPRFMVRVLFLKGIVWDKEQSWFYWEPELELEAANQNLNQAWKLGIFNYVNSSWSFLLYATSSR